MDFYRKTQYIHHSKTKLWVQLEASLCATPLIALPWLPTNLLSKQRMSALPLVVSAILQVSRISSPQSALFTPDGPMTPLLGNPALSVPTLLQSATPLLPDKLPVFHFLLSPTSLKLFEELVPDPARSALL